MGLDALRGDPISFSLREVRRSGSDVSGISVNLLDRELKPQEVDCLDLFTG